MSHRWGVLTAAFFMVSCGVAESRDAASTGATPVPPAPGVLRVVCGEQTTVSTPQVRARRDGVHVMIDNSVGLGEFYMRSADDPNDNHGGFLRRRHVKDVSSHAPGRMLVGCFERGDPPDYYDVDERFAEFEIVDPHELWIPIEVACSDPKTIDETEPDGSEMIVPGASSLDDVERYLRERFDLPREAVRMRPGYPETEWKGNPLVLRHEDETITYFHAFVDEGKWRLGLAQVCA